jgi:hypothetical protein
VFAPILTFIFGAATGGLLVRRGRTPAQIVAAVTGTLLAAYILVLAGDLLALYLDYDWSLTWLAAHLLQVDPLLLQALALAMSLLHFAIFPSICWAFVSLQHRRFAILLGTVACGSLLAMYVVAPKRFVDTEKGLPLYKYSRDAQNCIQLYNRELKFDPNSGAELREAGGDIIQEYQRQKATRNCKLESGIPTPKPTSMPRLVVMHLQRPADDRLKTPPFTLPARNYGSLLAQGTNIWSESISIGGEVTLLKLAAQGWSDSAGWVQPVLEESTYLTDQVGNRYRLLADYGRYLDTCASGDESLKCHKMLPGEVYRFELAFEKLSDPAEHVRFYYSGLNGPAEAVAFPVTVGEWRLHPDGIQPVAPVVVQSVTPARNQPQLPDPVPEQPTVQHGEDPSTPVAPVLCSTPVVIRSSTLPGNFDVPSPELLKLDWVTARLYLLSGARRPEYPLSACMHHLSGAAVLDLVAGLDGTVRVVRPVKGDEVFLTAAAQAVRTWQFRPVYQRGQAARIATRIEFDFGLNE